MKITFTKNFQGIESGNEFYKAGTEADLRRGEELVNLKVARVGWGSEISVKKSVKKISKK
jgi:hypothetical protein